MANPGRNAGYSGNGLCDSVQPEQPSCCLRSFIGAVDHCQCAVAKRYRVDALDVHNLAVQRSIVDLSGKLDQNVDAEFRHGDYESALLSSLPEYLLVPSTPLPVMQALWFLAAYSELTSSGRFGGNALFHRNIERRTFGQTCTTHQGFPDGPIPKLFMGFPISMFPIASVRVKSMRIRANFRHVNRLCSGRLPVSWQSSLYLALFLNSLETRF